MYFTKECMANYSYSLKGQSFCKLKLVQSYVTLVRNGILYECLTFSQVGVAY
jgi:hypothetical protein